MPERKNNRGRNLEFRYQVTMMDKDGYSLESEWVDTKQEAIEMATKILKKNVDVDHCMIYNQLNDRLSFRFDRSW